MYKINMVHDDEFRLIKNYLLEAQVVRITQLNGTNHMLHGTMVGSDQITMGERSKISKILNLRNSNFKTCWMSTKIDTL